MIKNLKVKMKGSKGITLIALVVTIIVLIILAGISVNLLLGENGLITRAKDAKVKYQETELEEQIRLSYLSYKMLEQTGKNADLKTILQNIDGVTIEDMSSDTFCVKKDGVEITVNTDGDIEKGKMEVWQGQNDIKCPRIENGTWYIDSPSQLNFLAYYVNNGCNVTGDAKDLTSYVSNGVTLSMTTSTKIELTNDLDMGARKVNGAELDGKNEASVAYETANASVNWTPIGLTSANITNLGIFDGRNHTIKNLYVNRTGNFAGIFGNSNTIQNLTIKNSYIKGGSCTGGIVGALRSGKIEDCHNKNTTVILREGNYYTVGGVVGQLSSNTQGCYNSTNLGNIIAIGYHSSLLTQVGGICGCYMQGTKGGDYRIYNCINNGNVKGNEGVSTGGIVGSLGRYNIIELCENYGNVQGSSRTGGISGNVNTFAKIQDCSNFGNITLCKGMDGIGIGGIAGFIAKQADKSNSTLEKCYNLGNVKGNNTVGGIVGQLSGTMGQGTVKKCYSKGNITGTTNVGEIIGYSDCTTIVDTIAEDTTGNILKDLLWLGNTDGLFAIGNIELTQEQENEYNIKSLPVATGNFTSRKQFLTWIDNQVDQQNS